jgi:hypothetical protein
MATKPLKLLERVLTDFSKCGLKSLDNQADFDSAIRRFESSRPSQTFPELGDFDMTGEEARILRASAGVEIEDRVERVSGGPIGGRLSNLDFPISGFYTRAWPRPVWIQRRRCTFALRTLCRRVGLVGRSASIIDARRCTRVG